MQERVSASFCEVKFSNPAALAVVSPQ